MIQILDNFANYRFTYYPTATQKIIDTYNNMYKEYLDLGYIHIPGGEEVDGAILLEDEIDIIGGIFYSLTRSPSCLFIMLAFVKDNFRGNGIYKKFHQLITPIAFENNKGGIISLVDMSNKLMLETTGKSVGYVPIMQLFYKKLNQG